MSGRTAGATLLLLICGCGITDAPPTDPDKFVNLSVVAGGEQVGLPGTILADPLTVRLRSTRTNEPITEREVRFSASAESGIAFTPAVTFTNAQGIAQTQVRLGNAVGRHRVEVTFADNPGAPLVLTLEAGLAPVVAQVSPATVTADEVLVITGSNFGAGTDLNEVLIDGAHARIIAATSTRLEVRVPACMPTRTASIIVRRGALESGTTQIHVAAAPGAAVSPAPGEVVTITGANLVSCLRISGESAGAEYIVITQNIAASGTADVPMRLIGLRDGISTSGAEHVAFPTEVVTPEHSFTAALRERERRIFSRMRPDVVRPQQSVVSAVPEVGHRRTFKVFVPRQPAADITAVARAVGKNLVIYEDVESEGSLPQADLENVLALLDDPVYTTDLAVYGSAPDLDRNDRVVVLLTPAVNRLTRSDETSFITGYFDPCDMVSVNECSDTNQSEILYSFVPDPDGRWGLKHPVERVIELLPPLAAHEFAHLIHFNQRVRVANIQKQEELWLSEALAHFAEDTVAGVLRSRGLTEQAEAFLRQNRIRASHYLEAPEKTSLISSTGLATIEERGAGWLLLSYIYNRMGPSFVRRMETNPGTGAANVSAVTGVPWNVLMRDWSVALFAAGSADLDGITLPREHTFGSFDLRAAIDGASVQGFALSPSALADSDFSSDWSLPPAGTMFSRLRIPPGAGVNLILMGEGGSAFGAAAQPQVSVFRIR